jgi:hypothetical protein
MKQLFLALFAATLWWSPALAQSGPVGIGFVQAEEGTWWCRGPSAAKAFACAMDKCKAAPGNQSCHEMRWCGLAGWSGTMVIWLPEYHSTSIVCGAPSEAAVTGVLKALCDNDEVVTLCQVTMIIDPDGKERLVDNLEWQGPTSRETTADDAVPDAPAEGEPAAE